MAGRSMTGRLFRWGPGGAHVAFASAPQHKRHVVVVGGLTDGLLHADYVPPLAEALAARGWSLVNTLLSSSHTGWGLTDVVADAYELLALASHLREAAGSEGIVLLGSSTGCQDAVFYTMLAAGGGAADAAPPLRGVVLQAPASDREFLATLPETPARTAAARAMVADGRGHDVLGRAADFDGAAVTAERWIALAAARGEGDDLFSSDLSPDELRSLLGHMEGTPTLCVLSGADEFVPNVASVYPALGERLVAAMGATARLAVVEGGDHALKGKEDEFVRLVAQFVDGL